MSRPNLPEHEKRTNKIETRYNDAEIEKLDNRAKAAGRNIARFIREASLSDNIIQIVSRNDKIAARRVRNISHSLHQLYQYRIRLIDIANLNTISELQTNPNHSLCNFDEKELVLWREISDELNELNIELLGYADNHN
jgi:hypothetical protein